MRLRVGVVTVAMLLAAAGEVLPQGAVRRVTNVAGLVQYPGYFHLQNVLAHGELVDHGSYLVLRGGNAELPVLLNDAATAAGSVEVRGQFLDVGRLQPDDPRLRAYPGARDPDRWPRPGEELVLSVTGIAETPLATTPSVRALALQPWRFEGQTVTIVGDFRGRNLYGDLPSAPGRSRFDFVLRSADAALWVTDLQPRGRGFDLSVDARVDTGRWLQVTGTVSHERGLVTIVGATITTASAPEPSELDDEEPPPVAPPNPGEVVFSTPIEGEVDVPATSSIRVQFSRGLDPESLVDRIRVYHVTTPSPGGLPPVEFTHSYDAANRAVEIRLTQPPDRFSTIRIEVLEGVRTFDGAPVRPWTLTFSVGG